MPERRHAGRGHRASKAAARRGPPQGDRAPVPALERRRRWAKRRDVRIGIPRVLNLYSTGPFCRTYFEALGLEKQNVVFSRRDHRGDVGQRAASTARSIRATRRRSRRRTSTTCSSTAHTRRSRSTTSSSRPHARADASSTDAMDTACCPIVAGAPEVMKAAFTKEIDFFAERGIEYLDPALTFTEPLMASSSMFDEWGPRLGVTEDESDFACRRGAARRSTRSTTTCRARARRSSRRSRRENRVALADARPPVPLDPGLNHGVLEEFQVLGYPILSMRSIPKDTAYARPATSTRTSRTGVIETPLDVSDVWPENYSANWRRRCGRRSSPRATRTSSCSICRPSSAATTRRPTASSTRSSRRRRRRTRRCTTSTRTSRAARSRSASRPTPTR